MTNDLTGRALDEAAARAMGWTIETDDSGVDGDIHDAEGKWRGPTKSRGCYDCGRGGTGWPTEREMLAWLTKDKRGVVHTAHKDDWCYTRFLPSVEPVNGRVVAGGTDLREALERLVVAVAAREAKA